MSYLLDTCILSNLRKIKKYPDPKLESWLEKHKESAYFISVITLGEIQSGISKLDPKKREEGKKRSILEDWFLEELIPRFEGRILSIDPEVALTWGRIIGEGQRRGATIPAIDALIAATAIVHNLTVVTENTSDFLETGARLFNPWVS